MGKGSARRPASIPLDQVRANWDRIFRPPCPHEQFHAEKGHLVCECGLPVTELWMQEQEDAALAQAREAADG